jgi:hypothetical protein
MLMRGGGGGGWGGPLGGDKAGRASCPTGGKVILIRNIITVQQVCEGGLIGTKTKAISGDTSIISKSGSWINSHAPLSHL